MRDLYEKMKSLEEREKPLVENDFGVTWLGNLVTLLGKRSIAEGNGPALLSILKIMSCAFIR